MTRPKTTTIVDPPESFLHWWVHPPFHPPARPPNVKLCTKFVEEHAWNISEGSYAYAAFLPWQTQHPFHEVMNMGKYLPNF